MSAATVKLRKKAADLEQKKLYQKALEAYVELIESSRGTDDENDASLFNRVGDLHLRLGNIEDAVNFYERAVDLYTEGGFFNNAIALCNKILRHAPNRNAIYYKLGKISATKGFNSDAKKNFLEYADRMQRIGNMDEAFRSLEEFADLCPGQDDIRLMLAEQLSRANRKAEALEQLQRLHETLESEGRRNEAAATLERMRAIEPNITPRTAKAQRIEKTDGLVFLDLNFGDDDLQSMPPIDQIETSPPAERLETTPSAAELVTGSLEGLEPTSLAEPEAMQRHDDSAVDGLLSVHSDDQGIVFEVDTPQAGSAGLDITPLVEDPPAVDLPFLLDEPAPEFDTEPTGQLASAESDGDPEFVDLGDWLREDVEQKSSRMIASDDDRVGDEQAEFSDMLAKFKQGVAANIEAEDFDSHYDLGVAYREMGLIDEAIAEFQKAVRGQGQRARAYEAIGQSFIDMQQYAVAHNVLLRALKDRESTPDEGGEEANLGILYLLGLACENLQRYSEAASYYQKVLADDIGFRDVLERLNAVTEMAR